MRPPTTAILFPLFAAGLLDATPALHTPLGERTAMRPPPTPQQLHGRFLHITDLHPDSYYRLHASTEESAACHRGQGTAGTYGAETSDCDAPHSLINATFKWIDENIKGTIDFVVWTGDSARHDSDESIPRTADEVLTANSWIANKFGDVFRDESDPDALSIPVVPTFGNNDILPHNILLSGPNKWLKTYTDIWSKFIPEEQRHGFERGGWFYVEVIPNQLAVFSLNTLYFFSHNAAVDGCALRSEPGYEHLEWLRIQLQFMRRRGMKAILTGHVPPARTESKQLWDETCWQKYTLWLRQYRDVVIGGLYGHMNIDHFILQDTKEIDLFLLEAEPSADQAVRVQMDDELTTESASDYLQELRENWSDLPNPVVVFREEKTAAKKKKGKKSKKDKALKKIGGPWGERFHATFVSPSVVPNFFPTLRVIEYNITGLDRTAIWANSRPDLEPKQNFDWLEDASMPYLEEFEHSDDEVDASSENGDQSISSKKKKKGKKDKKKKKPSNPDLIIPSPPSKRSPPGPAYSPQTLTLLGYTQYFANLTVLNNDFTDEESPDDSVNANKWHEGKHHGNHPKGDVAKPRPFQYQVEYDTFTDPIYKLKDMTVRSFIKLAHRIGQYKPQGGDSVDEFITEPWEEETEDESDENDDHEIDVKRKKGETQEKKKHHKQHEKNKVWLRFIRRAFVGTLTEEELTNFNIGNREKTFARGATRW